MSAATVTTTSLPVVKAAVMPSLGEAADEGKVVPGLGRGKAGRCAPGPGGAGMAIAPSSVGDTASNRLAAGRASAAAAWPSTSGPSVR